MMMSPKQKIILFLVLTFLFSGVFYALILTSGNLEGWTLALMWCPGIAALITQWVSHKNLRGLGWRLRPWRFLLLGYGLPILYGLLVYGVVWASGAAPFKGQEMAQDMAAQMGTSVNTTGFLVNYVVMMGTLGMLGSIFAALGEEIGWRGLLVSELARLTSFPGAALISGAIWALWHFPLILFSEYNNAGAPRWLGMIFFTVMVLGISFALAWMRLKSGSFWGAVILHASHNIFIQGVFTPLTGQSALSPYLIDEFGVGLALVGLALILIFWSKRAEVEQAPTPS
ncbi:CPBP family intramembrane glutamic endopeptidase [Anaerolinea thermophila]|nr:type II CAAX endopeptidase family protein [Anaerolinea thermophila]